MNTYQVIVEELRQFVAHVQADNVHEATVKALTGECELIETKTLPPKVKLPVKLGV